MTPVLQGKWLNYYATEASSSVRGRITTKNAIRDLKSHACLRSRGTGVSTYKYLPGHIPRGRFALQPADLCVYFLHPCIYNI